MKAIYQRETTGETVSVLGILTVLTSNVIEANHLSPAARKAAREEMKAILKGERGPSSEKVQVRSVERCVVGGMNVVQFGQYVGLGSN